MKWQLWETRLAVRSSFGLRWTYKYNNSVETIDMKWISHSQMSYILTPHWKLWFVIPRQTAHGDRFHGEVKTNFCAKDLKNNCNRLQMDTSTLRHPRRTQDMHMNWHPSVRGPIVGLNAGMERDLCGLPTERTRWVIPAAVLSHSKCMTTGWLSKPLSSICLIWAFCLHPSSAPRLKAAALPLFASLLGSEENDNNEAWRLSTASHTNIHTYNTRNTYDTAKADTHSLCAIAGTHTPTPTHTHTHTHTHTRLFTHTHAMWNECR